jgi:transcriptional regulator with XRE-family HTH domain
VLFKTHANKKDVYTISPKIILAFNLKRLRTLAGLSQEELADRARLHRTYISSVERGQRNVSLENIFQLAKALGADPRDLLKPIPQDKR